MSAPLANPAAHGDMLLRAVLIQIVVMIAAARVMNLVFRRLGQPGVVGEIVAGLLLGPSALGWAYPAATAAVFGTAPLPAVSVLSQLGLILLMFQIGSGFEFAQMRRGRARRAVMPLAAVSVGVPLACGIGLGFASHATLAPTIPVTIYALFCGVAMAITAVPILGRILVAYGLAGHELGVLAISAAAINDVAGWVLLGIVASVATASFDPLATAARLAGLAAFAAICLLVLRPAAARLLRAMPLRDGDIAPGLLAVLLIAIFALSVCTYELGIFGIFGGFVAGLLVHHDKPLAAAWNRQVGGFVMVFLLPVFFTLTGLHTNLLGLDRAQDWAWVAAFVVVSIASKIAPVGTVAAACGYSRWEGALLGSLMNTRALMELIVLNIGLETGFLPQRVFTMLVIMAVATTLMTGPLLNLTMRWAAIAGDGRTEA